MAAGEREVRRTASRDGYVEANNLAAAGAAQRKNGSTTIHAGVRMLLHVFESMRPERRQAGFD
jgi:hypothetical protein